MRRRDCGVQRHAEESDDSTQVVAGADLQKSPKRVVRNAFRVDEATDWLVDKLGGKKDSSPAQIDGENDNKTAVQQKALELLQRMLDQNYLLLVERTASNTLQLDGTLMRFSTHIAENEEENDPVKMFDFVMCVIIWGGVCLMNSFH